MIRPIVNWLPDQIIPIGKGLRCGTATWREILPGAVGAGLFWELVKKVFLLFVSTYITVSNLVYGSVAAIIAFLAWAYLSGLIFLFGAYLSVSYYQKRQQLQEEAAGQIL